MWGWDRQSRGGGHWPHPGGCRRKAIIQDVQDGALVVSSRPPGKPLKAYAGDDVSPFLQGVCVGVWMCVPITYIMCLCA